MSRHNTSDAAMAEVIRRMKAAALATKTASRAERERAVVDAAQTKGN